MLAQLGFEVTLASWFGTADAAAMAVTDQNSPARVQRRAGMSVRVEDADNDGKAATVPMMATTLKGFGHALAATRAHVARVVFCTGFAPWVHDRSSRVHRAVT